MRDLLSKAETFEFITDKGTRLPFDGVLLSWADDLSQDIAEHKILKRSGAIHQVPGNPPPKYQFEGVLLGKDVTARYRALEAALDASPLGQLVHPRLGMQRAVCHGVKAKEDPGSEIDVIMFSVSFSRSGLRPVQALSAQGQAAAAAKTAAALVAGLAARAPAALAAGVRLQSYVEVFQVQAAALSAGEAVVPALQAALAQVQTATGEVASLIGQNPVTYDLVSLARLCAGQCLAGFNVAVVNRPPIISKTVPMVMGLGHFLQSLYGARAREIQPEVELLNRLARPYALPALSTVLLPDPVVVLASRR